MDAINFFVVLGIAATAAAAADVRVSWTKSTVERFIYDSEYPVLRIPIDGFVSPVPSADDLSLVFSPPLEKGSDYVLEVVSSETEDRTMLKLSLVDGKKWAQDATVDGLDLMLSEVFVGEGSTENRLAEPAAVARVIPTPSVRAVTEADGENAYLYQGHEMKLTINGTGFRSKKLVLVFAKDDEGEELSVNVDYSINVKSENVAKLLLQQGKKWRSSPGPLLLRQIDTGGGLLKVGQETGGVLVAYIEADPAHAGITVESGADQYIYQTSSTLMIKGTGFSSDREMPTRLRFANGIKGMGKNYTIISRHTDSLFLELSVTPDANGGTKKWKRDKGEFPSELKLLAATNNKNDGWVSLGPQQTNKKGRVVAKVLRDPAVNKATGVLARSHDHELTIEGVGLRGASAQDTALTFDPPLEKGVDYLLNVVSDKKLKLTLMTGQAWRPEAGPLSVVSVNTGGGAFPLKDGPTQVAEVVADDAVHESGVQVFYGSKQLYQSAHTHDLVIVGAGFEEGDTEFVFDPPLVKGTDYWVGSITADTATLKRKKHAKWRPEPGSLLLMSVNKNGESIPQGSGGKGIQVAEIMGDPQIATNCDIVYNSKSPTIEIKGAHFNVYDTQLTFDPPLVEGTDYAVEFYSMDVMALSLYEGRSWVANPAARECGAGTSVHSTCPERGASPSSGRCTTLKVTMIDTPAGEVEFIGAADDDGSAKGVIIATVTEDPDGEICNDDCFYAKDGVCDDKFSPGYSPPSDYKDDYYYDDDYSWGDDDDDYWYYSPWDGYYDDEFDDDDVSAMAWCMYGTDCTDCAQAVQQLDNADGAEAYGMCTNDCEWARDGMCDDPRVEGICRWGTDCQDCGPVGQDNFTLWDDNNNEWWEDDDDFFGTPGADDESFWNAQYIPEYDHRFAGHGRTGLGGTPTASAFINTLEGIVYFIGAIVATIVAFVAVRWWKGQGMPYLPIQDQSNTAGGVQMRTRASEGRTGASTHVFDG